MILETKLTLPQPKPGVLLRTGLIALIKNNLDKKLILITAGAGYGKTTLLAQLTKEARLPASFYHLDKNDSDLMTFYSYMIAGLEKLVPGLAAISAGLLKQGGQIGNNPELLMGTLINELLEKRKGELFFILDDYQNLSEASPVHQALDYFIDHLPDTVHVIIAARGAVRFASLSKWLVKQDALLVTKDQLAFHDAEVRELLAKSYNQALSDQEIDQVVRHTEGWITAIQLILQQAVGCEVKRTVREIITGHLEADQPLFEYFIDEIFCREELKVKDFLVKTSFLEFITPEIGDELLGIRDSAKLLKGLEIRNLFVVRAGRQEYKYHRLFRDFLHQQMTEETERSLHLRAAAYYQRQQMIEPAIGHLFSAGEAARAAELITKIADGIKEQGRLDTMADWLQKIPADIFSKQPCLMMQKAALYRERGRLEEAEALFKQALAAFDRGARGPAGEPSALADTMLEYGGLLWIQGKFREALKLLKKALAACPESESELKAEILNLTGLIWDEMGNYANAKKHLTLAKSMVGQSQNKYTLIFIESNLACLLSSRGETQLAYEQYVRLVELIGNNYYYNIGVIFGNAARTALEYGNAGWAEKCLTQGRVNCRYIHDIQSRAALDWGLGNYYLDKEQWPQAGECFQSALKDYRELGWKKMELFLLCELGSLKRFIKEYGQAREYFTRALAGVEQTDRPLTAAVLVDLGIVNVFCREATAAGRNIAKAQKISRQCNCQGLEFQILLARATLQCCRHKERQAHSFFKRAVRLSDLKGYKGMLSLELRHNPYLLKLAGQSGFGRRLLKPLGLENVAREGIAAAIENNLRIGLLGSLQICLTDGRPVPLKWSFRKVASLFAYLAINHNRVCSREELLDALWPKVSTAKSGQSLRPAIHALKRTLADGLRQAQAGEIADKQLILHQDKGYRLSSEISLGIDTETYQEQWQKARSLETAGKTEEAFEHYRRCLDLYRGRFLPDLGESWCEQKRSELEKKHFHCLKTAASLHLKNNDFEAAAEMYNQGMAIDPYAQDIHRGYWTALQALGRKSEIKNDYVKLEKAFRHDLNEDLEPETKEAFQSMVNSNRKKQQ